MGAALRFELRAFANVVDGAGSIATIGDRQAALSIVTALPVAGFEAFLPVPFTC